ncbi:MAG: helix-turn-helix domain-containing protein [Pseudomonadota bacterium]
MYIEMDIDEITKALANRHRRLMLKWLKTPRAYFPPALPEHADLPGACASYIYEKANLSQGTVSQYLSQLERAGLIVRSRHGKWTFFHRDEAAIAQALDAVRTDIGSE